jgi:hypothetical protein
MLSIFWFLISQVSAGSLFTAAVYFKEPLTQGSRQLVSETCLLTGRGVASLFSRSRFVSSAGDVLLHTPHTSNTWRLISVTCLDQTHPALNSAHEPQLLVPGVDSCEDLLAVSATPTSLAVTKTMHRCMPLVSVTKELRDITMQQISGNHSLISTSFPTFAWEYTRRQLDSLPSKVTCHETRASNGNTWLQKTERLANNRFHASAKIMVSSYPRMELSSVQCGNPDLEIYDKMEIFMTRFPTCKEDPLARQLDLTVLCATIEDARQAVVGSTVGFFINLDQPMPHCFLEAKRSQTLIAFVRPEGRTWRMTEIQCQRRRPKRRVEVVEGRPQIEQLLRKIERRLEEMRQSGAYAEYEGLGMGDGNVDFGAFDDGMPGECMALKMEMYSGLSFNQLCGHQSEED